MAFNGKYEIESDKNYDEFMKRLGEWGPTNIFLGWSEQLAMVQEPKFLG